MIEQKPHESIGLYELKREKNYILYQRQKELLFTFFEKGAISKEQYEKSLHDLTEKMGAISNADSVSD